MYCLLKNSVAFSVYNRKILKVVYCAQIKLMLQLFHCLFVSHSKKSQFKLWCFISFFCIVAHKFNADFLLNK